MWTIKVLWVFFDFFFGRLLFWNSNFTEKVWVSKMNQPANNFESISEISTPNTYWKITLDLGFNRFINSSVCMQSHLDNFCIIPLILTGLIFKSLASWTIPTSFFMILRFQKFKKKFLGPSLTYEITTNCFITTLLMPGINTLALHNVSLRPHNAVNTMTRRWCPIKWEPSE